MDETTPSLSDESEPRSLGDKQLLEKLQLRTHAAIDSLQMHILELDMRLGGGQAAQALAALSALVESVMLHYVSEQKILQAKHHREYVCIERSIWDKAKGQHEREHGDHQAEGGTDNGRHLQDDPGADAGDASDREGPQE